jgi:hypothetical protein
MYTKNILLVILSFVICLTAKAQDRVIKKNGEVIEAKVSVINQEFVVFKRADNLSGPEYSLPKADIAKIIYANGTEDIFEENNDKIGVKRTEVVGKKNNGMHDESGRNRNIVSLMPIAFTENGMGIGASIEHMLDTKGVVNFYMPVMATFNRRTNIYTGSVVTHPMFYFMPGIKVYTNPQSSKKAKFSIGPSLVAAFGTGDIMNENLYTTGVPTEGTVNRTLLGAMAIAGFNLFPSPHLYLGVEYGLGFCYVNNYGSVNQGFSALTQGSIKIGYRFK